MVVETLVDRMPNLLARFRPLEQLHQEYGTCTVSFLAGQQTVAEQRLAEIVGVGWQILEKGVACMAVDMGTSS